MRLSFRRRHRTRVKVLKLCEYADAEQELDNKGIPDFADWGCSKTGECAYLENMSVFCPERDMLLRRRGDASQNGVFCDKSPGGTA